MLKLILFYLLNTLLFAGIDGQVFQELPVRNSGGTLELNTYGKKDLNELGVANIKVTAYPDNISTITDSNGTWHLDVTQNSRIEFSNIPDYLKESSGLHNSVQFVKNGDNNISFGLHNPNDFSATKNPTYVSNIQQNGTHIGSNLQSLQFIKYNSTGMNQNYTNFTGIQGSGLAPIATISIDRLGSIWGKAYQKNKKRLFVSSMLQRHIGLKDNPSTIYIVDYSNNTTDDNKVENFSIQGLIPSNSNIPIDLGNIDRSTNSNYTLPDLPTTPNVDFDAYAKVGKISYGGIDIDENNRTLWLVNLHQKGLISIDISKETTDLSSSSTTINQYLIKDLANVPTCKNGELRPWALKIHEGAGYLGTICDANESKSKDDLSATVLKFNLSHPENGFEQILSFDLNYSKELRGWHAWEDNYVEDNRTIFHYYAEPILSDIEFDKYNNIYLSFLDRHATQSAVSNYPAILDANNTNESAFVAGELLKVCYQNGIYSVEGTNNCLTNYSPNPAFSYTTPPTTSHEFFNDFGVGGSHESSNGALALLKGSDQLLATVIDPHPEHPTGDINVYFNSQGVHTFNLKNGSIDNWYATAMTKGNGLSWKANGMGDIELITEAAPIEIGDRVWFDENSNGIQDANETGIKDVNISLICDNNVFTATTDNNGNYLFSNNQNNTSTVSHIYGVNSLVENNINHCYISIPNIAGNSKQNILNGKELTQPNQGEGTIKNINDSNGILNNNNARVAIIKSNIPVAGHNNHSFDIGFKPLVSNYTLGDHIWTDTNHNGIEDTNETGLNGVTVNLYNSSDCTGAITNTTVTANGGTPARDGFYQFDNLNSGNYCVEIILPTNFVVSPNSDANASGHINNINLTADSFNASSVGLFNNSATPTYSLGDYIWLDTNRDGIQDANESGINGITVNLYSSADCTGAITNTQTTFNGGTPAKDGFYQFTGLTQGDYCVEFILPANHTVSPNTGGNDSNNSDANTNGQITNINLTADTLDEDIGIYNNSATPTYSLGDHIWTDTNHNGIEDTNETGLNGVTVNLYNSSDCTGAITNTTVTANGGTPARDGFYQFDNLNSGNYCVEIILPTNFVVSPNSDANASGHINNINLTADSFNASSVGLFNNSATPTYSLGDYIWLDTNRDGIQDANESGINGITVNLYSSADCTGAITNTQTTFNGGTPAKDGFYQFTGLTQGDYCVEFILPANHTVSPNTGGNDSNNSDANTNGQITNINLTADTLDEDIGIYPTSIVLGTAVAGASSCNCKEYTSKSVDALNLLSLLILVLLTTSTTYILLKNEL